MHEVPLQVRAARKNDGSYCWNRGGYREAWRCTKTIHECWDSGWRQQVPMWQVCQFMFSDKTPEHIVCMGLFFNLFFILFFLCVCVCWGGGGGGLGPSRREPFRLFCQCMFLNCLQQCAGYLFLLKFYTAVGLCRLNQVISTINS